MVIVLFVFIIALIVIASISNIFSKRFRKLNIQHLFLLLVVAIFLLNNLNGILSIIGFVILSKFLERVRNNINSNEYKYINKKTDTIYFTIILFIVLLVSFPSNNVRVLKYDITSIQIYSGETDKTLIITDSEIINEISKDILSKYLHRKKFSILYTGHLYKITFKENSKTVKEMTINSDKVVKGEYFFYHLGKNDKFDIDYIENIMETNQRD